MAVFLSGLFCGNTFALPHPLVVGISPMSFLSFSNLTVGESYQLQHSFAWYWTNFPVSFTAANSVYTQMVAGVVRSGDYRLAQKPVPTQAFAMALLFDDAVVLATITDGGSGYVTAPAVSIVGGGGTNATAIAYISSSGVVTNITITSNGTGYTNSPIVKIGQPPAVSISPAIRPVMRLNVTINEIGSWYQFTPKIDGVWQTCGPITNTQTDVFITNDVGFFRLSVLP
jgi:hypothetical protein